MQNREATDLIEAIRLQKLRAAEIILDYMDRHKDGQIAVALEIFEDVYAKNANQELFEQNKNYDPESTFSLNSEEILKSICSFFDIWCYHELNPNILFCFLSTNKIAKERKSTRSEKLNLNFPSKPILELLSNRGTSLSEEVSELVKRMVLSFYTDSYGEKNRKNIEILDQLSEKVWLSFLSQINWVFGHPEVKELESRVITKIKGYELFSAYENQGQEEVIKSSLLDLVEKKSTNPDRLFRLVFESDVRNVFLELSNSQKKILEVDEVHKLWETIEKPTDTRNLSEKILNVCPNFNPERIKRYERKASIAKAEEKKLKNSPKYLALKYRVFEYCDGKLFDEISQLESGELSEDKLIFLIDTIRKGCVKEFNQLKEDYDYGFNRESIIMELFLEFVDSCYLSFEKNE
ncbi:hypothetical protein [Flagellimonas marina]|uniref:Uncharacterized protein n=1 Tax=Flagellimonas marina TaxID=1775168 RepID=A0ABV8PG72_9FLAO